MGRWGLNQHKVRSNVSVEPLLIKIQRPMKDETMKVEVAKSAGFCSGVRRAVDLADEAAKEAVAPVYTYGPIVHNQQVVDDLRRKGVEVLSSKEELEQVPSGTIILRSHGVGPDIYRLLDEKGLSYIDATCPFVKRIHRIVEEESRKGSYIVVIGDPEHPEVKGIVGWAGKNVSVIQDVNEAQKFELSCKNQRICIVSQTTFNYIKFQELVEIIHKKGYDIIVQCTICNTTKERQEEAQEIASRVDLMLVIGDEKSANTRKLYELCKEACENTYYIQTLEDLNVNQLRSVESVGITAGASTPDNLIEEVQKICQS